MTTTPIDDTGDHIQKAQILARVVWDALCDPDHLDLVALTAAANKYLDKVKVRTPEILAKAYAVAWTLPEWIAADTACEHDHHVEHHRNPVAA